MDIKKSFEIMKKDLKKEIGLDGGFTMSKKQIENRTATLLVCNDIPYETEIERENATEARVQGYDTWTAEEKARSHESHLRQIARYTEGLNKYGTKENEAKMTLDEIVNSKAFAKFQSEIGKVDAVIEKKDWLYYIRFHY